MTFAKILYWIVTIISIIFLYTGFVYLIANPTILRQETLESCMKLFGEKESPFSILCGKQHTEIVQPIWLHLIPYLPAGLILGLSRLLKINLYMLWIIYNSNYLISVFFRKLVKSINFYFLKDYDQ